MVKSRLLESVFISQKINFTFLEGGKKIHFSFNVRCNYERQDSAVTSRAVIFARSSPYIFWPRAWLVGRDCTVVCRCLFRVCELPACLCLSVYLAPFVYICLSICIYSITLIMQPSYIHTSFHLFFPSSIPPLRHTNPSSLSTSWLLSITSQSVVCVWVCVEREGVIGTC